MEHTKLFIPGPVEVSEKTFRAMATPMIGHRSAAFRELYGAMQPKLQQLLYTKNPVFLATSSSWGVMEASVRNLVKKKVLNCCCGAFSDKWNDVSLRCGLQAEALKVEWGQPILPELIEARLKTGQFDAITLVHNETSTGLMNPLAEIEPVMKRFPDVMWITDAVSSMGGVKIETDALDIDVLIAGSQKCFALPPGLVVFAVSDRALQRAATVPGRGYYFDFLEYKLNHDKNEPITTPSLPHYFAMRGKLDEIFSEGLDARFARHRNMAEMVRAWALGNGFGLFPKAGYESHTLTCIRNDRNIDVIKLQQSLRERHHALIDAGYGKLKGKAFRIGHMGDETTETVGQLLTWLDECLATL